MPSDLGSLFGAVLLVVTVVGVVVYLARRVIVRRRAARRVARWTREYADRRPLLAESAHPVTPGHDTPTARLDPPRLEDR